MQYKSIFFFNDTATTEIYTLSLHDALPISHAGSRAVHHSSRPPGASVVVGCSEIVHSVDSPSGRSNSDRLVTLRAPAMSDRKSTRLNSSHANISYAVFCLKKKKTIILILAL